MFMMGCIIPKEYLETRENFSKDKTQFNSNVSQISTVLLNGCETRNVTDTVDAKGLKTFINSCLRKILKDGRIKE